MTTLLRYRRAVAAVLAAALAVLTRTTPPDLSAFAQAGQLLLEGRLADVYAGAWNQAGPAQLLAARLLLLGGSDGEPAMLVVAAVDVALVAGAMARCRRFGGGTGRELVAGLLALLWVAAPLPWNGHPAEVAIPVLWAYGIVLQRRNRNLAAAAALALAVAIAPWAILGIPCLLAAAPPRRALATGMLAAALGVGSYLPFVLSGQFAMFEFRWSVWAGTLASMAGLEQVTWWLRLAQGAVVAAGVGLIGRRCRHDRLATAVVPLAAALLRVATDPVAYPYYWYPVAVASLLLFVMMPAGGPAWRRVLAGGIGYLALLGESADWTLPTAAACLAGLLVLPAKNIPDTVATFPGPAATR